MFALICNVFPFDRFQCLSEPKWDEAKSGRKVLPVNKDVKENLTDSDAIPNPIFWINSSNCSWNNGSNRAGIIYSEDKSMSFV